MNSCEKMNKARGRTKETAYIAIATAMTVGLSFVRIPFYPVSFTLQTFSAMLAGLVLKKWPTVISQLFYLALRLLGLPVFTQGGGFGYVFNPTFGYLLFLPVLAYLVSVLHKKLKVFGLIIPAISLLAFGTLYYIVLFKIPFDRTILSVFWGFAVIFIPAEILKAICAYLLGSRLKPLLKINN